MISRLAKLSNEALHQRWSTVIILALILTVNRAVMDKELASADTGAYVAKLFVTLLLSLIISLAIHVVLYVVFSPKKKTA